jgi:methyl-accepting chemotaxis protein
MAANMQEQGGELVRHMGIDHAEQQSRKAFIDFGMEDVQLLRELKPLIQENADSIVDGFYSNIERYGELIAIISDAGSSIDRLKAAQKQYLLELFDGDYGNAYVERRLKIGIVHNKIGLTPRWYLGSYSVYSQLIYPLINKKYRFNTGKALKAVTAVNKILTFDAQLAIDTYINAVMMDLKSVSLSKDDIENTVVRYRNFIEGVATGDLSQSIEVNGDDDLGQLGIQLNTMTQSLAAMARQTSEASNSMSVTLNQMLGTVSTQSSGASEQAAAVNEATTTLEEIRAISMQTREKAEALGSTAERTRKEGEKGMESVELTVSGMKSIREKVEGIAENILALSEQTQQIGEITGTVSNLAHQLKMLALNASIEAAKAGDAGKGFAVVAAEVKNLAEQSQQATEQVNSILQEIQHATDKAVMVTEEGSKGVDEGMSLVNKAGTTVRKLTEVIKESALASQQIAASVRQEATGIDQITTAMSDINGATSQFVSATQQTREAAEDLGRVASQLRDSANAYKL